MPPLMNTVVGSEDSEKQERKCKGQLHESTGSNRLGVGLAPHRSLLHPQRWLGHDRSDRRGDLNRPR